MLENILFEDRDIIVVKKPFGIPSQPDKRGSVSLIDMVGEYLGQKHEEAELGLIHRLDQPVSGIMVLGKNKEASAELSRELCSDGFKKEYIAVCCGRAEGEKRLVDWIFKNQRLNISKIVNKNSPSAKEAILEYKAMRNIEVDGRWLSLVKVRLYTGRHHQIRVQLANAGLPLWGDTKYNPEIIRSRGFSNIGLCAYRLELKHPRTGEQMSFEIKEESLPFSYFK